MAHPEENNRENTMEKIISLAKRKGFIFQGSEIYGGLAGTWDFGPYGVALRSNIKNLWWKKFVTDREDMFGIDAAILMNQEVWKASGHVGGFSDPLVECKKCKHRFRADQLSDAKKCPDCGGQLGEARQFNMMFKTNIGAAEDALSISYLRPETAQGMFVNFKNVVDSFHPRLPFGLAQIGKAFRNEIAPRDFVFRSREFEQMEIEYFVDPRNPEKVTETFDAFYAEQISFLKELGLSSEKIHKIEVPAEDRAHYSKRSVDTEFDFPFGQKELLGIAYRTDFDLKAHTDSSKVDLSYFDEETKERFIPHCIEPTFGLDRLLLAVLSDAYTEDEVDGEKRVYLKLAPKLAPVKVAVFPLLKNKPQLVEKAREVYMMLKKEIPGVMFDDNGNIGKRYRRQGISFDDLNKYKKYIIKPCKQVNKNLIIKETDNILRILATLALKENTQSNIVRKLSSHKSNDTLKALIELDKIIMSLYILDYVDDEEMRKCVHRSLNRGESYHQLRSAISKVSGKKLIGKTEIELIINNECARLLAICIIFYNAYLLSGIYEHCKSKGMLDECKKIIRLSPVAWQHISLVGKYEFTTSVELPKLDTVMAQLISNLDPAVVVVNTKKFLSSKAA